MWQCLEKQMIDAPPLTAPVNSFAPKARPRCPECGERLAHWNGCVECWSCGYSSCG